MLLDMLLSFKKEGLTSIIITHKLNEVAYCADRITVLRDGATIETIDNPEHNIDEERIIKGMVGRELTNRFPSREHNISDEVVFEARNWTVYHPVYNEKCVDKNVSFKVHKGEIIGFSGLQGAGRTELAMSLFGKSYGSKITGTELIKGKPIADAMKLTNKAVAEALDGLPDYKMHCSVLAEEAIKSALDDYDKRRSKK
jgi:putative multiple sugar transport system ATP-binding protein